MAELNLDGSMTVLRPGANEWTCIPGDQNIVGAADMCADPMGMVWIKDIMAGKPEPANTSPGLIYMLNGATQHSFTDPFDQTSPAIPIGPHWMLIWPFDAKAGGLPCDPGRRAPCNSREPAELRPPARLTIGALPGPEPGRRCMT